MNLSIHLLHVYCVLSEEERHVTHDLHRCNLNQSNGTRERRQHWTAQSEEEHYRILWVLAELEEAEASDKPSGLSCVGCGVEEWSPFWVE